MAISRKHIKELIVVWGQIIFDVTSLTLLFGIVLLFFFVQKLYHLVTIRGFFCDDASIRYPLVQPHIPGWIIPLITILASIVVILVGNIIDHVTTVIRQQRYHSFHPCGKDSRVCSIPPWISRTASHLKWYYSGLLLTILIAMVAKSVVGALQPNFLAICKPDLVQLALNCTDDVGIPNYVTDYTCTGDPVDVFYARMSWPSMDASVTSFDSVFLAVYISSVRMFHHRSVFKLILKTIFLSLGLILGIYNFVDHISRPVDIISGWILGGVIALFVTLYNLHYFSADTRKVSFKDKKDHSELEPLTGK